MKNNHQIKINYSKFIIVIMIIGTTIIYSKNKIPNCETQLKYNWSICSSEKLQAGGAEISSINYDANSWYATKVPSTVMGTLVADKVYQNVFVGENLKDVPVKQFEKPWWYRTEFTIPKAAEDNIVKLKFEGINYRADIWLNGKKIADADSIAGVYRMFEFNISPFAIRGGKNVLAVEVYPPIKGDPTIGFVDWNPEPPDRNMGIWRPVKLELCGDVSISYPFVKSKINLETLKEAELTVSAEVQNNISKNVEGMLSCQIGKIKISKEVNLSSYEKKTITFSPEEFHQLKITNPRIWWTYNFGKPNLYNLKMKFTVGGKTSDITETKFGIREVSDYINKEGFRGYKLNGKKILVLGGGWVDNLFLDNDYKNIKAQIAYVKQMGLNTIRLEGIWGDGDDLFNLCDENGILIMAGWSCQWEWEEYLGKSVDEYGGIKTPEEMDLISKSWKDQIKWLRNHPSIFLWLYGSDKIPRPELEKRYQAILKEYDSTRPFLASAAEHTSLITGSTAVKMRGPYDYVPPIYWWKDKSYGGAFGFDTEVSPGAEVPPIETIEKMIPKDHQWPIDSVWNYHCGKNAFSNLTNYDSAMINCLGEPGNLEEYCTKAQFMNYEDVRSMFEAEEANKFNATGIIHWMLNASWPKLWWQLYDYYLMPGGAFFGAKKACEPIHILYNIANHKIIVVNNTLIPKTNFKAIIRILNFDLSQKLNKIISFNLPANKAEDIFQLPDLNNLTKTYYVDLEILDGRKIISTNFYCLSTRNDVLDTAKTNWYITPTKQYRDLKELNDLKKIQLTVKSKFITKGDSAEVTAEVINNTKELAFQIVLMVTKGKNGSVVLPILWNENYFSLLPGEKRIIKGLFSKADLQGQKPVLKVSGWNINQFKEG